MLTPILTTYQLFSSAGAPHAGPLLSLPHPGKILRMEAEAATLCHLPFGIKSNN